jgi:molybdopterin molybdotransferase
MALMPVAEAYAAVLKDARALPEEMVALTDAHHRTLSRDIAALRTQPPADMSAMDGYAVRAADAVAGARLKVIGEVAAGRPFNKTIGAGQAARIFTGGIVPDGADAVVIQEDAAQDGGVVIVNEAIAAGKNIRRAGIDYREGEVGLRRGSLLNDRALALAAGMNHPQLPVHRRPRVAILATGDELVAPGTTPALGQIVYSNFFALSALVRSESAEPIDLGIARDTLESTAHGIQRARDLGVDVLVTTGGASVGDHDLVQAALKAEGFDMAFWKIALRPGKPMMHGRLGPMRVLGLPGNPVSSYVCAFLFLVPLIRALSGRTTVGHSFEHAVLGRELPANDKRQDYLRARLENGRDGLPVATSVGAQDSSLVGNLAAADALIVRAPFAPAAPAGAPCTILRLPN